MTRDLPSSQLCHSLGYHFPLDPVGGKGKKARRGQIGFLKTTSRVVPMAPARIPLVEFSLMDILNFKGGQEMQASQMTEKKRKT